MNELFVSLIPDMRVHVIDKFHQIMLSYLGVTYTLGLTPYVTARQYCICRAFFPDPISPDKSVYVIIASCYYH